MRNNSRKPRKTHRGASGTPSDKDCCRNAQILTRRQNPKDPRINKVQRESEGREVEEEEKRRLLSSKLGGVVLRKVRKSREAQRPGCQEINRIPR